MSGVLRRMVEHVRPHERYERDSYRTWEREVERFVLERPYVLRRVMEARAAQQVEDFYHGETPPLPLGVVPEDEEDRRFHGLA